MLQAMEHAEVKKFVSECKICRDCVSCRDGAFHYSTRVRVPCYVEILSRGPPGLRVVFLHVSGNVCW